MYILSGYTRLLLTSFVKHWRNIIISIAHGDDGCLSIKHAGVSRRPSAFQRDRKNGTARRVFVAL